MSRVAALTDLQGRFLDEHGDPSFFHMNEFQCRCGRCNTWQVDQQLIWALEKLRLLGGFPLKIISGVRCREHNRNVGGATESQHLPDAAGIGGAADVQFYQAGLGRPARTAVETYLLSLRIPSIGGRGLASSYLHLDMRPSPAEWLYNGSGKRPSQLIQDLVGPAL